MLKIWGRLNSVNVEKVVWCARELSVPFERIDAGGVFGLVDTPAFRALNPFGRVPVIEDDGFVLWESNAIVRYLCARHGLGTLMPDDLRLRADAEHWMDFQLSAVAPVLSPVFRGLVRTKPDARDMALITRAFGELKDALAVADGALATRTYLVDERFTMADIPLACACHRWFNLPLEGTALARPGFPHLLAWYERLKTRPIATELMVLPLT